MQSATGGLHGIPGERLAPAGRTGKPALCCVSDNSKARYRDVTSESRYNVMERATDIAGITGEHMSQIDAALILKIAQFKKGTGNFAKKSCKYQIF